MTCITCNSVFTLQYCSFYMNKVPKYFFHHCPLHILCLVFSDDQPGHPEWLQLLSSNHQPHADQQPVCKNNQLVTLLTPLKCSIHGNLLLFFQADAGSEVNNELANRMSLFYASATPMLKMLSDATSKFVSDVSPSIDFVTVPVFLFLHSKWLLTNSSFIHFVQSELPVDLFGFLVAEKTARNNKQKQ